MIPHSKPFLGQEEKDAVASVLETGLISLGEQVSLLEEEFAKYLGLKGAVAVSSGTAGLHLALLALEIDAKSKVHIPSYVCTALLNAVNYCSAEPDISDVNPSSGNIDLEGLQARVGNSSKAVIVPHMFGTPCDIREIKSLGIPVIEDCAQSVGAEIDGKKVGKFGDISVFSFYATKVITAGEGGIVASNSSDLLSIIRDIRDYDHKSEYRARFNYKMTDIQAALARIQLQRLPYFIQKRRDIAAEYDKAVLSGCFSKMERPEGDIYYRYLFFSDDVPGKLRRFRDEGVRAEKPVFRPLHKYLGLQGYTNTEKIHNSAVSIPCYPALTDLEIEQICEAIITVGTTCSAAH